jgi:hypothetical protein
MGIQETIQRGLAAALVLGITASSSWAGDPIFLLTHGDQDALVLGKVTAATPEMLQFQPTVEIPGQRGHLPIGKLIEIRQTDGGRLNQHQSPLAVGDRALVSLRAEGDHYRLAWGAFQVSSLELPTLRITNVEKSSDLIMLQWYLNSCGQDNAFSGDGSTVFVQSNRKNWPIGQKLGENWVMLGHATCSQWGGVNYWSPWMGLAAVPIGLLSYLWARRSRGTRAGKI